MTRCAQATAHSVRAGQWVAAGLSLERRQERDAERRSKLYSWEGQVINKREHLSAFLCLTLRRPPKARSGGDGHLSRLPIFSTRHSLCASLWLLTMLAKSLAVSYWLPLSHPVPIRDYISLDSFLWPLGSSSL